MSRGTILVLGGYGRSLIMFRGPLLAALRDAGWSVIAAAPAGDPAVPAALQRLGVTFVAIPLARAGLNPLADIRAFFSCCALMRARRPDIVLAYTLKPVAFGCLAAAWCGVPRIYGLITGLGSAFLTAGLKGRMLSWIAGTFYRAALPRCTKVFVQNGDIRSFLVDRGMVKPSRVVVVPGSGVDLEHYAAHPVPAGPMFLFVGRFLRDKGVFELVAAARAVRQAHPEVRVVMVGGVDVNAASVSPEQVAAWRREGDVEIVDTVDDVRPYLRACTVFVLPSYHEGIPRSALEAMGTGRAILTTDVIGARETVFAARDADSDGVRWGRNGALVPVGTPEALAVAMRKLATKSDLPGRLGRESRILAEQYFDVKLVNSQMISEMNAGSAATLDAPLPV